jgi:uncharacterized DUF497 family protein
MSFTYDPNKNKRNVELRDLSFDRVADLDWDAHGFMKMSAMNIKKYVLLHTAC